LLAFLLSFILNNVYANENKDKIESIQFAVYNPKYDEFHRIPAYWVIGGTPLIHLFAGTYKDDNDSTSINKKILSDRFQLTIFKRSAEATTDEDEKIIRLFEDNIKSDGYKYNREDFKDNTAFAIVVIFWESSNISYLSIDTSLRMHLNGKHIKYKLNLIKAILPYLNDDIREDVERYVPMWSTPPRDPQE
jgi:hypothetical protein